MTKVFTAISTTGIIPLNTFTAISSFSIINDITANSIITISSFPLISMFTMISTFTYNKRLHGHERFNFTFINTLTCICIISNMKTCKEVQGDGIRSFHVGLMLLLGMP